MFLCVNFVTRIRLRRGLYYLDTWINMILAISTHLGLFKVW